jgi:hypothetical protein
MLVTEKDGRKRYCPIQFALATEPKPCLSANRMAWKKFSTIPTTHEKVGYSGLAGEPSQTEKVFVPDP